jgi:hypothetical protein
MSEAEARMADLWAATAAPSRDLAFALAVEERIARRLMLIDVAGRLGVGLVLVAALFAFGPLLVADVRPLAGSLDAAGPVLAAAAALSAVVLRLTRPVSDASVVDDEESGGLQV